MSICTGCTKGQHPPIFTQLSTLMVESGSLGRKREWEAWLQLHRHFGFVPQHLLVQYSANHPFPLSTRLSTLVVESGSLGRKREWEAWLLLHRHFGIWTPSLDPSIPSHSPPGSPPSWSKAGVLVESESGKHGSYCTVISDL
ncbi:hypothetical protein B0H13DRAFT_1880493 [Mycena leptocephala]|nr:hypothetical protein B0H13DRAFT_1880493 [Mycena leptocephala]